MGKAIPVPEEPDTTIDRIDPEEYERLVREASQQKRLVAEASQIQLSVPHSPSSLLSQSLEEECKAGPWRKDSRCDDVVDPQEHGGTGGGVKQIKRVRWAKPLCVFAGEEGVWDATSERGEESDAGDEVEESEEDTESEGGVESKERARVEQCEKNVSNEKGTGKQKEVEARSRPSAREKEQAIIEKCKKNIELNRNDDFHRALRVKKGLPWRPRFSHSSVWKEPDWTPEECPLRYDIPFGNDKWWRADGA